MTRACLLELAPSVKWFTADPRLRPRETWGRRGESTPASWRAHPRLSASFLTCRIPASTRPPSRRGSPGPRSSCAGASPMNFRGGCGTTTRAHSPKRRLRRPRTRRGGPASVAVCTRRRRSWTPIRSAPCRPRSPGMAPWASSNPPAPCAARRGPDGGALYGRDGLEASRIDAKASHAR